MAHDQLTVMHLARPLVHRMKRFVLASPQIKCICVWARHVQTKLVHESPLEAKA